MFRFLFPYADGTVMNLALGGKNLEAAFDEFRRYYWNVETPGAIAVYHNAALVARILPTYDPEKEHNEPRLELWK